MPSQVRWALGTGRCGTRSLAQQIGGIHEPQPWTRGRSVCWARNREYEDELLTVLRSRSQLETPCVSCLQQSYLVPLIRAVDPNSSCVFLIRKPLTCVNALTRSWQHQRGINRIGWVAQEEDWQKAAGHYLAVNSMLLARMLERFDRWTVVATEDLTVHANRGRSAWVLNEDQEEEIERRCGPLHDAIRMLG